MAVDGEFDGVQEVGLALDLVDGDGLMAADEELGIASGGVQGVEIVQCDEASISRREFLGEGALAGLASAGDDDGGHDAEAVVEGGRDEAREEVFRHVVHDNHSWCEWEVFRVGLGKE